MIRLRPSPITEPVPRPILIGACPRSGSTVLGAVLGVGPHAVTVPESDFRWRLLRTADGERMLDLREAVAYLRDDWRFRLWGLDVAPGTSGTATLSGLMGQLARAYGQAQGKPDAAVWVDHTPGNVMHALTLRRHLPNARFVHLLRDGRAVTASVLPLDWGPNNVFEAARWWATNVAAGLAMQAALGDHVVRTVRFEDLVSDPDAVLPSICDFLDLPFDPHMTTRRDYVVQGYTRRQHARVGQALDVSRIDAWRDLLPPRQVETFEYLIGDLLETLGYRPDYGGAARPPRTIDHVLEASGAVLRRQLADKPRRMLRRASVRGPEHPRRPARLP